MKKVNFILLFMLTMLVSTQTFAQTEQEQRIHSSYILAFDRKASDGELNYWKTQGNLNVSQLLERHKGWIKQDRGTWDGVLRVSYTDAFGRGISDDEYKYHIQYPRTYFEMMNGHMQYLNSNPQVYEDVIKESYKRAYGRQPSSGELNNWKSQAKVSFIWLFRAHLEYAKTQKSNSISTKGLKYVSVTPAIFTETRNAAAGIVAAGGGNIVAAGGGNIVAAGAGNIVAAGGGNIVAAGAGN